MSDPRRLLDARSDGTAEERGLLAEARSHGVPASVKAAIWTAVVAQGATVAASAAAGTAAAAKAGALAGPWLWKGVAILAVLGAGAATSVQLLRQPSTPPAQVAPKIEPTLPRPAGSPRAIPGTDVSSPPAPPSPKPPSHAADRPAERARPSRPSLQTDGTPVSRLAEEAQSLVEARRLVRAGALTAALSLLERGHREFAGGRLAQEREALLIEVLAKTGRLGEARRRAATFLDNYPTSPHVADVKRHVDGK